MTSINLPYIICSIIAFVPAIVLHEMGHAFAAYKLGDPTAKKQGRLSFNPLNHIDPFGTVIMPLMLMVLGMPVFGYAKPVPYNPQYFEDPRKGDLIVGLAFFCPVKYLPTYYKIQQYALPIFLLLVLVVPQFLHFDPIGMYLNVTAYNLFGLIFPAY